MLPNMQVSPQSPSPEPQNAGFPIIRGLLTVGGGFLVGILLALMTHVPWLAGLQTSLSGANPHAFWYVSRATAFVAFALLWLSMVLGLSITNKLARLWPGGPAATDLHQYTSLLGLALGSFHGLILLGDGYSKYTPAQLLLPFATAQYRPLWVGLGQVGLYIGLLVSLTFYIRRFIGYRVWRLLHYLSFAFYLLVLFHGFFSGTDSGAPWAVGLYLSSVVSLMALTIYRIVVARRTPAPRSSKTAAPAQ
ncbi:MAG: ferric reductase-like transmembrane domain-containing protein [Herpetosiphonaceae bacterium]|nr:ferric reductase-like transmembrane domain-containing protein [Herpetosiphonaceae bacterium]